MPVLLNNTYFNSALKNQLAVLITISVNCTLEIRTPTYLGCHLPRYLCTLICGTSEAGAALAERKKEDQI